MDPDSAIAIAINLFKYFYRVLRKIYVLNIDIFSFSQ